MGKTWAFDKMIFLPINFKTHLLGGGIKVFEHRVKVIQQFCYDNIIIDKKEDK